jgi:putative NADPH-quinone reductase
MGFFSHGRGGIGEFTTVAARRIMTSRPNAIATASLEYTSENVMKTLVIAVHPHLEESRIHRAWLATLRAKQNPDLTVHDLYNRYPDEKIDVRYEQALLRDHDRIIFEFPIYWYSSPPLLKKWFDEVLEYGWAYGQGGHALEGKEFGIAISTFTPDFNYQHEGSVGHTIEELTWPFEATVRRVGGIYLPAFVLSGVAHVNDVQLANSGAAYLHYLDAPRGGWSTRRQARTHNVVSDYAGALS